MSQLRPVLGVLVLLSACNTAVDEPAVTPMSPSAQLVRVSMALRGERPSLEDLDRIEAEPEALEALALEYVQSTSFSETVRDLFAEVLLMRSAAFELPGSHVGLTRTEMRDAMAEPPLDLIARVVEDDLPFSEIVTADWTMLDEKSARVWGGTDYNLSTGGDQQVWYTEGRPAAGILSTGSFLLRHESNGGNYSRGRASLVSEALLCTSFSDRDIPIEGDLDEEDEIIEAVWNDPACVSCHQSVDPIASTFLPFRPRLTGNQVNNAYEDGCPPNLPPQLSCYPVDMYLSEYTDFWQEIDMRPPGYWGAEVDDLAGVGEGIATDPRFSQCMAKRFASYLTQTPLDDVDPTLAASLQQRFIDSDFDARDLAVAVVTDPQFLASDIETDEGFEPVELQTVRPEQLHRMVADLTGLELAISTASTNGDVPLLYDDVIGFRAMTGGIDGATITAPSHLANPVRLLGISMIAEEAAGFVVPSDLAAPTGSRRLLQTVTPSTTDEASVRAEIAALYRRMHGMTRDPASDDVTDAYTLWSAVHEASDTRTAWSAVVAALLQSPDTLFY